MSASELLSVTDCATLCRVSEDTIREYARLGFLTAQGDGEQMRFKEAELRTIFGISVPKTNTAPIAAGEKAVTDSPIEDNSSAPDSKAQETPTFLREQIEVAKTDNDSAFSGESFVERFRRMRGEAPEPQVSEASDEWGTFQIRGRLAREESAQDDRLLSVLNSQLAEEVKMLREERDWLRQRLEKLEARSERDQMLLLSESENVRGLVDMHQNRKSFWLRALPWLKPSETSDR